MSFHLDTPARTTTLPHQTLTAVVPHCHVNESASMPPAHSNLFIWGLWLIRLRTACLGNIVMSHIGFLYWLLRECQSILTEIHNVPFPRLRKNPQKSNDYFGNVTTAELWSVANILNTGDGVTIELLTNSEENRQTTSLKRRRCWDRHCFPQLSLTNISNCSL